MKPHSKPLEPTTNNALETSPSPIPTIKWWHWTMGLGLAVLSTLLTPRSKSPEFAHLIEGSVSQTKIIAPFDFEILKSTDELAKERSEAAETILPVTAKSDSIADFFTRELLLFAGESYSMLTELPASELNIHTQIEDETQLQDSTDTEPETIGLLALGRDRLFRQFGFRLGQDTWDFLIKLYRADRSHSSGLYFRFFENNLEKVLRDVYIQGIINIPKTQINHPQNRVIIQIEGEETIIEIDRLLMLSEALQRIGIWLPERLKNGPYPTGAISAAYEILLPFMTANVIYDAAETERRRRAAVAKVPLAKGFVKQDELIIDRNIVVKAEHITKLKSLAAKRAELALSQGGIKAWLPALGYFLLIGLIIGFLGAFIALMRKKIWLDWKLVLLTTIILGALHISQALIPVNESSLRYLLPVALAAMLLGILVDRGVAMAAIGVYGLIGGLLRGSDFPTMLITICVGSAAVMAIRKVRARGDVMRATLYLLPVYIIIAMAYRIIQFSWGRELWSDLALAGANSVLSPILALGLVFIFEKLFRITTDLSLLELVDLNQPLLRDLAIKSPGTYHHSIMVGSLAEAAAHAVGANALLTRAGAFYHDIGKMINREYFIENQEAGSENVHNQLPPSKSAQIVINHVPQGLQLADQYKLPPQVKAFIAEHHGRTKLAYFYAKARKELGDDVPEERFSYPGPNPQSKETGILMLADVVEAATRSNEHPSSEDIRTTVAKLIRQRLESGDLDDCPLTLKEINLIQETFIQVLGGMHHQRIPYPSQAAEENI